MSDIELTHVSSGYNLNKMNSNFDKIEDVVNDEILHTEGGNNTMEQALDMNSYPVINGQTDVSDPTQLLTVKAADARYNTKLGNENTSGLGEFRFNSVAQMKSMTDITGNTLTEDDVAALADSGAVLHTNAYYNGTPTGGGEYQLRTRANYRTEIGDAAWVPDGYGDHYLLGGSDFVAVRCGDRAILSAFGGTSGSGYDDLKDVSDEFAAWVAHGSKYGLTLRCDVDYIQTTSNITVAQNGVMNFDGGNNNIVYNGAAGTAFIQSDSVDGTSGGASSGFIRNFSLRPGKDGLIAIDGRRLRDYEYSYIDIRDNSGFTWSVGIDQNHSWSCKFSKVAVRNCIVALRTGAQWNANGFWGCKLAQNDVGLEIQSSTGSSMLGCELEDNTNHIKVTGFFGSFYFIGGYMERGVVPLNIDSSNIDIAKMVIKCVVSSPNNSMETFCRLNSPSGTLRLKMDNIEFRNDLPTSGYFVEKIAGNLQLDWDNVAVAGLSPSTDYELYPLMGGLSASDWRRLKTSQKISNITLGVGYSTASSTSGLGLFKDSEGWVRLRGTVNASTLATDTLGTLPSDLGPSNLRKYLLLNHSSADTGYTESNANLIANGTTLRITVEAGLGSHEGRYSIDANWALG